MKITYYLGAGASYYAVPIVGELDKAFMRIENLASQHEPEFIKNGVKLQYDELLSHLQTFRNASKIFGTIDTYAKHLWLTNTHDFFKLKKALSLFFTIWQETEKSYFNSKTIRDLDFEEIDHRYLGLLANFMEKANDGRVVINGDIKFVSWNYDNQLEKALSLFSGTNDIVNTFENYKIYPYNFSNGNDSNVIHLNGIAGMFERKEENNKSFIGDENFQNKLIKDVTIKILKDYANDEFTNKNYFTFAWEDDNVSKEGLKQAEKLMNETEILVVIGYSFPTFNDQIDKKLFSILGKSNKLKMIYYQDPNASIELLNSRFGISEKKIKIIHNISQFVLPLESNVLKNSDFNYSFM